MGQPIGKQWIGQKNRLQLSDLSQTLTPQQMLKLYKLRRQTLGYMPSLSSMMETSDADKDRFKWWGRKNFSSEAGLNKRQSKVNWSGESHIHDTWLFFLFSGKVTNREQTSARRKINNTTVNSPFLWMPTGRNWFQCCSPHLSPNK